MVASADTHNRARDGVMTQTLGFIQGTVAKSALMGPV